MKGWYVSMHFRNRAIYVHVHVVVISWARGMYGIYCTETRGLRAINTVHLSARDTTILYPVGIATMDTHRTLEKQAHLLLETDTQSRSPIRALQ